MGSATRPVAEDAPLVGVQRGAAELAAHSRLAPSGAPQWVPCPGSLILQEQFPEEEGVEAQEGTAAHWIFAEELAGREAGPLASNGIATNDEMREAAAIYVEDVQKVFATLDANAIMQVEYKTKAPSIHDLCWGTLDTTIYDWGHDTIYLWDFKYGHGFVEVFENWQTVCYLAGILDEINSTKEYTIIIRIVQPRWYGGPPVREWKTTSSRIREMVRQANASAHEALGDNPRTHVGPHCKYCTGRHACKALQIAAIDAVETSSDARPLVLAPPELGLELRLLKQASALLEMRLAGLESQAMAELRAGKIVPGWAIEHSQGREEWIKPSTEVIALGDMLGVKLGKDPAPLTPAQARKAGMPADVVAQYCRRKTGEAKLTPVSTVAARAAFGG